LGSIDICCPIKSTKKDKNIKMKKKAKIGEDVISAVVSLPIVALTKIIRVKISTTTCVIAISGAFNKRKIILNIIPVVPRETTEEIKVLTLIAIIAPPIAIHIKIIRVINSIFIFSTLLL